MTDPCQAAAPAAPAPLPATLPAAARPGPPPHTRFQKGQTGNRKGAPPRPAYRTAQVEALMQREFDVVIDGENRRLPLGEALLLQLAHRALAGEAQAATELIRLMGEVERVRAEEARRRADRVRAGRAEKKAGEARRAKAEADAALARELAALRAPDALDRPRDDREIADRTTLRAATLLGVVEGHPDGSDPQAWVDGDPGGGRPAVRIADWALEAALEHAPDVPLEGAEGWQDPARAAEILETLRLARRPDPWAYACTGAAVFSTPPRRLPRWLIDAALDRRPGALDGVDDEEDEELVDVLEGGVGW